MRHDWLTALGAVIFATNASAAATPVVAAPSATPCEGDVTLDDTTTSTTCAVIGGKLILRGTKTPNLDAVVEVKDDIDMMLRPVSVGSGIQAPAPSPQALSMPKLKRARSILITYAGIKTISLPGLESVDWIWFRGLTIASVAPMPKLLKAGRIEIGETAGANKAFVALVEAKDLTYSSRFPIAPVLPELKTITGQLSLAGVDGGGFPKLAVVNELQALRVTKVSLPLVKKVNVLRLNSGVSADTISGPDGFEPVEEVGELEVRATSWLAKKDRGLIRLKKVGTLSLEQSGCSLPAIQAIGELKLDSRLACLFGLRKYAKKVSYFKPGYQPPK
jgi:hypothetical protein